MNDEEKRRAIHQTFLALPGYPWLPCPICKCTESCDHTKFERANAAIPGLAFHDTPNPS